MNATKLSFLTLFFINLVAVIIGAIALPGDVQLAIHWGADMAPDQWVGKWLGLGFSFLLSLVMPITYWLAMTFEPRKQAMQVSKPVLGIIMSGAMALIVAINLGIIVNGFGYALSVPSVAVFGLAMVLIIIGNYLGKTRANYTLGIRLPWTLKNEQVWNKTHRLAGKLFILLGIVVIAANIWSQNIVLAVLLGGIISIAILSAVYAHQAYKHLA